MVITTKSKNWTLPFTLLNKRSNFKENYDISQSDYESLLDGVVIHVSGCELFIDTVDIY